MQVTRVQSLLTFGLPNLDVPVYQKTLLNNNRKKRVFWKTVIILLRRWHRTLSQSILLLFLLFQAGLEYDSELFIKAWFTFYENFSF